MKKACRCCGSRVPKSDGLVVSRMIFAGLSEVEAQARLPICEGCVDRKYVSPSRGKYHADPNINAVCLWCESRRQDPQTVSFHDEGPSWMANGAGWRQRLPKGDREVIPARAIFARLDGLAIREKSTRRA